MEMTCKRWEIVSIAALTAGFILLASLNLGAMKLPSSCWQPSSPSQEVILDLGSVHSLGKVYIFLRDANRTKFDLYGATGPGGSWEKLYSYDNLDKVHFCYWDTIDLHTRARLLKFHFADESESPGKIGEIMVSSGADVRIPLSVNEIECMSRGSSHDDDGCERLVDEQDVVQLPVTSAESAYFDEMYFVRTAWEHLNLEEPYEWTHPPLGKLIIALGILIFGMNPIGWRVPGLLAAAAMIPAIFWLSKCIFRSGTAGVFAASLLTFDFMHFSLARLATGEIYIALFSLLSFMFAFLYLYGSGGKHTDLFLFLSIVSFGLCFSVKWTALFGLFAVLSILGVSKKLKPSLHLILAGLVVSAAIYLASYIPAMLADGGHGLIDVLRLQFYMFGYHAGISATHPFSSPWWSWPVMLKPLWMYSGSGTPEGTVSTVVLMGNPAIWWGSIPALVYITIRGLKELRSSGEDYTALFICMPFLILWLPYALITRILFIYHFVAEIPFMILAITYCMMMLDGMRRRVAMVCFIILVIALFALFYPVISGYPIGVNYKESLRWLPEWIF